MKRRSKAIDELADAMKKAQLSQGRRPSGEGRKKRPNRKKKIIDLGNWSGSERVLTESDAISSHPKKYDNIFITYDE